MNTMTNVVTTGFLKGLFSILLVTSVLNPALAQDNDDWTLCPEPGPALQDVPAGPAEIQADIDRFTLCLDRAELLLKLEEVSNRNDELLMGASGMGGMVLPVNPTPLTQAQTEELMASNDPNMMGALPPIKMADYTILGISGAGGALDARLNTPDGDIQMVRIDDRLEDGSVVSSISASQVFVRKDGKTRLLQWDN